MSAGDYYQLSGLMGSGLAGQAWTTTTATANVFYPSNVPIASNTPQKPDEPDEIAWLKKRVKEIEWHA